MYLFWGKFDKRIKHYTPVALVKVGHAGGDIVWKNGAINLFF
jgi:hypothetical protein